MTSPQHRHRVLAGFTRSRLLAALRQADGPVRVRELAEAVGLHPNSVREQLDQLVDAGLTIRSVGPPAGRGRPGLLYAAGPDADDPDPNAYRELAQVLADALVRQPEAAAVAVTAGERWGRTMTGHAAPTPTVAEAVKRLVTLLDDAGFAPERPDGPGEPIQLRHCPFEPLARKHPAVVCGVHLGLMRGALRELGAPLDAVRLEPFVAPDLCIAHLGPRETAADGRAAPRALRAARRGRRLGPARRGAPRSHRPGTRCRHSSMAEGWVLIGPSARARTCSVLRARPRRSGGRGVPRSPVRRRLAIDGRGSSQPVRG